MSLEFHSTGTTAQTQPPPRAGLDLNAYLAAHSGDVALMLLIATAITIGHWRYWFYPDDLTLADGTASRRCSAAESGAALLSADVWRRCTSGVLVADATRC